MNILFLGDVVGSVGRQVVIDNLPALKEKYKLDFVICNAENSAHGKGITRKIYNQLINSGIDCITMGNHTFSKDTILSFIDDKEVNKLIRPINMEPHDVGKKYQIFDVCGKKVCVTNVVGEVFMYCSDGSPFSSFEKILENVDADIFIVDFHGEATSEKLAFAYHFKNKINACFGTHTHVQTADERIIGNCGYISDAGMCGVYDSILGRDSQEVIERFVHHEKTRYTIAEGDGILCGVIIEIDDNTLKTKSIKRIQKRPKDII